MDRPSLNHTAHVCALVGCLALAGAWSLSAAAAPPQDGGPLPRSVRRPQVVTQPSRPMEKSSRMARTPMRRAPMLVPPHVPLRTYPEAFLLPRSQRVPPRPQATTALRGQPPLRHQSLHTGDPTGVRLVSGWSVEDGSNAATANAVAPALAPPQPLPPVGEPLAATQPTHDAAYGPAPGHDVAMNPEFAAVLERATEHNTRAFQRAARGAEYTARAEFLRGLRLLAQASDALQQTSIHSQALANGLRALEEADDFLPSGSGVEADIDLASCIGSHRTPVLKDVDPRGLLPLVALVRYYNFAQEQLAAAVPQQPAGSVALYGLGKLLAGQAERSASTVRAADAKSMVLFQAALLADPRNFQAANDLAVALGRHGRWEQARAYLHQSLHFASLPATWENLAVVEARLGDRQAAEAARAAAQQSGLAARPTGRPAATKGPAVEWLSPEQFAAASRLQDWSQPAPAAAPAPPGSKQPSASTAARGGFLFQKKR